MFTYQSVSDFDLFTLFLYMDSIICIVMRSVVCFFSRVFSRFEEKDSQSYTVSFFLRFFDHGAPFSRGPIFCTSFFWYFTCFCGYVNYWVCNMFGWLSASDGAEHIWYLYKCEKFVELPPAHMVRCLEVERIALKSTWSVRNTRREPLTYTVYISTREWQKKCSKLWSKWRRPRNRGLRLIGEQPSATAWKAVVCDSAATLRGRLEVGSGLLRN